jgi:hypothetical protein
MARYSRGSLLDDEIIRELHADQLSGAPSDCESSKSSSVDDDDSGPSVSQKGRKMARLEVSGSDVNIDDDGCSKNDDLRNVEQYLDRLCGLVVSFWLQIQRSRVRFPALPDFLRSRGSGPGFTQPRDYN